MQKTAAPTYPLPNLGPLILEKAGPAWFTGVMGTGIEAICATISPLPIPAGHAIGQILWSIDCVVFALLIATMLAAAICAPRATLARVCDPAAGHAWGAPPMACFTIAVGFLDIGPGRLNSATCIHAAQLLWLVGVVGSVIVAGLMPFLMFTRHRLTREKTVGSWLLSVVPPIVASVPAALLSPTWPAAIRGDMLGLAYALLGLGMILAAILIVLFYGRLVYDNVPSPALVPTTWLVIGPLGQSIAGTIALGKAAQAVWPQFGHALTLAATAYGLLVWGFAVYWLAMAITLTIRAARTQLPFSLGWWAFTFPVGVLVAGTDALATQTHAQIFAFASLALFTLLATLWSLVVIRTLHAASVAIITNPRTEHDVTGLALRPAV